MRQALALAGRGQGDVEPNPMVGAVIVRAGVVLGRGWHRRFGGDHAEIEAIGDARRQGRDVRGAEMFVTLEPCAHHGKTPPCSQAVIEAGLARVHIAMRDPFPEVDGRGIAAMEQAGIDVRVGLLEDEARRLNRAFIKRVTTGRPWVIAKWAQTLDGCIATRTGDSRWISGEASRQWVHRLRSRVDVIMTGIGTVMADDCLLTARLERGRVRRRAIRLVMDRDLRLPIGSKLVETAGTWSTRVACLEPSDEQAMERKQQLEHHGVQVMVAPSMPGPSADHSRSEPDIDSILRMLVAEEQATQVLVEAGPTLLGSMFRAGLIDAVAVFVCPSLLGDREARRAVEGFSIERMADRQQLVIESRQMIGEDILIRGRPASA